MGNEFTKLSENLLGMNGQSSFRSSGNPSQRIIYPAIVRVVEDASGLNRIKAEIVNMDSDGNIIPGKDKETPLEKLPLCIPLIPEYVHVRPQIGECVLIISENPADLSAIRYWIGPLITSQLKLNYQAYGDSLSIFKNDSFDNSNNSLDVPANSKAKTILPSQYETALQGRDDADITLKPREVLIRAGKFKKDTIDENTKAPCIIQLKQFDSPQKTTGIRLVDSIAAAPFTAFSQINMRATNINLISVDGKFRNFNPINPEFGNNDRLDDFGDEAKKLHPLVFGDELIKLLDLMIRFVTTHVHTPQSPPLPNPLYLELQSYLIGNKIQDLVSKNVRTN
jgi:hypothetical protein